MPGILSLSQVRQIAGRAPQPILWLVIFAVLVRLPGINRPLVGNFATRNVVSAMVARNWAEGRASLWYPTLDCLGGGGRQWILLEFPASTYITGLLWRWFGGSLDAWGRATSIGLIAGSVAVIYRLVRRRHGGAAAMGAAFALAVSPVSIVFGQSFMLEPSLVFYSVAAFYAQDRWLAGGRAGWLVVAAACAGLAMLTKIYMLVLLLPLAVEAGRARRHRRRPAALVALAVAVVPAAGWYGHAARTSAPDGPHAERVFYSVRQSADVHRPPHPLLTSPDFYRQLLDDLATVVLTPVAFTIALAGLMDRRRRRYVPWLAATALLIAGLPLKFYEMNYYWLPALPVLCILAGLGWRQVDRRMRPRRAAVAVLALTVLAFSLRYAVKPAFVTPAEDRAVVAAGRAVQQLAGPEEPVVTMHGSTIDLLYYCDRPGWAVPPDAADLEAKLAGFREQGARWLAYVATGHSAPEVVGRLPVVRQGDGYAIHALGEVRRK